MLVAKLTKLTVWRNYASGLITQQKRDAPPWRNIPDLTCTRNGNRTRTPAMGTGFYLPSTAFAAAYALGVCGLDFTFTLINTLTLGARRQVSTPSPKYLGLGSVLALTSPQKRSPNLTSSTPKISQRATLMLRPR